MKKVCITQMYVNVLLVISDEVIGFTKAGFEFEIIKIEHATWKH